MHKPYKQNRRGKGLTKGNPAQERKSGVRGGNKLLLTRIKMNYLSPSLIV